MLPCPHCGHALDLDDTCTSCGLTPDDDTCDRCGAPCDHAQSLCDACFDETDDEAEDETEDETC